MTVIWLSYQVYSAEYSVSCFVCAWIGLQQLGQSYDVSSCSSYSSLEYISFCDGLKQAECIILQAPVVLPSGVVVK